jgi:8-oxo-dGTP pyrophosphatase MutT (NUDIX family)
MELSNFMQKIIDLYEAREYRPEGMAVVHNPDGKVLIVQSKFDGSWTFPQGGIEVERGQDLGGCIETEVNEETGLTLERVADAEVVYYATLDYEPSRPKDRRHGFRSGKGYFAVVLGYKSDEPFILNQEEILDAKWATPEEARELFKQGRPEKATFLDDVLRKAIKKF